MTAPSQIVIFGASGDLTLRKLMPALASLASKKRPTNGFSVLGVARSAKSDEAFRAEVRDAMPESLRAAFDELAPRVTYMQGDVEDPAYVERLGARLDQLPGGRDTGRLFYLSLKPELFGPTVTQLSAGGILHQHVGEKVAWRRVVVEKPFGHDLATAIALNKDLYESIREEQIFRIDHYLGKETVQNLLGFRFHNTIFEPLWNRHYVELVQITVAEDIGIERGRAGYYDTSGALRDMVQNHMLQVLALVAMEPPASMDADAVRNEKVQVLRSLHIPDQEDIRKHTVRARYSRGRIQEQGVPGYLEEEGVPHDSNTETFVAIRAEIDAWRWAGVPFFLRHGKRMPKKFTEVQVQFRLPPLQFFNRPTGMTDVEFRRATRNGELQHLRPNVLTISIQPREAVSLSFGVKTPGASMVMAPAHLSFDYRDFFGTSTAPAYERLLLDALVGDATLFLRGDEIEASWVFADAILSGWKSSDAPPLLEYPAGSWGPHQAHELFDKTEGSWSRG